MSVKLHPRIRPTSVSSCDWRLGPWPCRAEHGGRRRPGVDLGNEVHTRRFRRSRHYWWRGLHRRGAPVPWEFLAGVPAADSKNQGKSPSSIWCARKYAIMLERCPRLRGKEWRRGRSRGASLLTRNRRRSLAVSAAR
jgi:hypothetical protein